jgi:hypothetical protein
MFANSTSAPAETKTAPTPNPVCHLISDKPDWAAGRLIALHLKFSLADALSIREVGPLR